MLYFVNGREATEEEFIALCEGSATGARVHEFKPQPWPAIILPLKVLAKKGDKGAGDIIARTIGPIGGDAFKAWYKKLFGKDCGCGSRQEVLNLRWPL